jgi:hypothetical protein
MPVAMWLTGGLKPPCQAPTTGLCKEVLNYNFNMVAKDNMFERFNEKANEVN